MGVAVKVKSVVAIMRPFKNLLSSTLDAFMGLKIRGVAVGSKGEEGEV